MGLNSQKFQELFGCSRSSEVMASFEIGRVVPDISPLVDGHVMLVANRHIGSYSEIGEEKLGQIDDFLAAYREVCFQTFGEEVVAFEHGVPLSSDGKNTCVEHAHIHIIPLKQGDVFNRIVKRLNLSQSPRLRLENKKNHYLAAWDHSGRLWMSEDVGFESQVFRREIGSEIGEVLWHWEDRLLLVDQSAAQDHYSRTVRHAQKVLMDPIFLNF
jgi:diadenosine tetraphosphate (Ap4A) HIT family hydrolase